MDFTLQMAKILELTASLKANEDVRADYYLRDLVKIFRPLDIDKLEAENLNNLFAQFTQFLAQDSNGEVWGNYFIRLAENKNFIRLFTETGIISNEDFYTQTKSIIARKVLPEVYEKNDIHNLIEKVFTYKTDYIWLKSITDENWSAFFLNLGVQEIYTLKNQSPILIQVLNSIQVVSLRINSLGVAPEIVEKFPQLEKFESPFMAQHKEITLYLEEYLSEESDRTTEHRGFRQVMVLLDQCLFYIDEIRKKKNMFGISFKLTNYLIRLRQNLKRLRYLLYLATSHNDPLLFQEETHILQELIRSQNLKKDLRQHFSRHMEMMAHQIVENTSMTGENYVTSTPMSYLKMFISSCGGGFIVAFLAFIKSAIYYLSLPLFGNAFFYSLNYSFGFILIHMTGSKLATKQPAMTASHLIAALEMKSVTPMTGLNIDELAALIKQIYRSQFISFVGNVLIALPVAYALAYLYFKLSGEHLLTPAKSWDTIDQINPFNSYAIFHASIAGVYLFLSGIITGYYDNHCYVARIPERLKNHPFLRRVLSKKRLVQFSNYIENNLGQLAGNFFLGAFLGVTAPIGQILGLPLDIQHITFSSGNFALALVGLDNAISLEVLILSLLGIASIGLFNFLVSFSLSVFVAIKSRGVSFDQTQNLLRKTLILFLRNPFSFFFPIK